MREGGGLGVHGLCLTLAQARGPGPALPALLRVACALKSASAATQLQSSVAHPPTPFCQSIEVTLLEVCTESGASSTPLVLTPAHNSA
jgi:hypothetical protein